ncbi:MAG: fused MFS/spermidine synthase [Spirochaetales bacterium]|nr:fused MFS/spermidine synthase [Spirochaetales bacterium]
MKKKRPSKLNSIIIPCITIFFSGTCIMILEIVAGRLIAKYLGASLYVWTSVISVVLGGITIGNFIGGRLADKYPAGKTLALLFGASSVTCVFIIILNIGVGEWTWLWQLSWPLRVFIHVLLVFILPSTLLGTISPVVAKMALDTGLPKGATIGKIYAFGAAGSIFGTLLAGFVLISLLGTHAIIWIIAALLLAVGILYWLKSRLLYAWGALLLVLIFFGTTEVTWAASVGVSFGLREDKGNNILYEDESDYCYIAVEQLSKKPDIRRLRQDDLDSHSKIVMGSIEDLQFSYTKLFAALTLTLKKEPRPLTLLSIGGGGYVFPRYALHFYPGSCIDVAEIDPGVTKAAFMAFGLSRDTPIHTIQMDARNYVDRLLEQKKLKASIPTYDIVYGDAFGNSYVPFQLVTKEFNDKVSAVLAEDGAYIINLIDSYKSGAFLGAVINTLKRTFHHTYVVSTYEPAAVGRNFIVVGSHREIDMTQIRENSQVKDLNLWILSPREIEETIKKAGRIVLTDDFAPVEQLLSPMLFLRSTYINAKHFINTGDTFKAKKQWRNAIKSYEHAIKACPPMSIVAFSKMSQVYAEIQDWEEIINVGKRAIEYNEQAEIKIGVSSIYYNIGILRLQQGKQDEGIEYMHKAIEGFNESLTANGDNSSLLLNLGNAYAYTENYEDAIYSFRKAIALDPANTDSRLALVTAYIMLNKDDEAKQQLSEGIRVMEEAGLMDKAAKLRDFMDNFEEKKKEYGR